MLEVLEDYGQGWIHLPVREWPHIREFLEKRATKAPPTRKSASPKLPKPKRPPRLYLTEDERKQRRLESRRRFDARPLTILKRQLRTRIYAILKRRGSRKTERTHELIGCSTKQFKSYIESQFTGGMSWSNRSLWHIDHIKPLALFDLTDLEQRKLAFHYTNCRPLWAKDNLAKGAKYG